MEKTNLTRWLSEFQKAFDSGDISTLHLLRKEIYQETIAVVKCGSYMVGDACVELPEPASMMAQSVFYQNPGVVDVPKQASPTVIKVVDSDSLLAGKALLEEGYHPAVLNFANRQTPGGGVMRGSGAQEENIFRRSNLFMSLYQYHFHGIDLGIRQSSEQYPMERNTGGVYSPDVTVFRGLETDGYPLLEHPYHLGIVTVAAMNRPELKNAYRIADHLVEPIRRKIRTIFHIALKHGHDAIVLGAWGCGAFKNPPQHIAKLFHEVLEEEEFVNRFKKVVFAIIDRKNIDIRDGKIGNMIPFQEEFVSSSRKTSKIIQNNSAIRFERMKGMFWGLVIGDCLGSPIQFTQKDAHPYITEMVACHTFHTPPGYWTDDSSMAFCVAESVVRLHRYSLEDIAHNFVRWYREGFCSSLDCAFDVGGATIAGIHGIERGCLKNGEENSQGNGSIMRFAPSYILNYANADNSILYEISDLTHDSRKVRETIDLMTEICDEHLAGQRTRVKSLYKTRADVNNSGWAVSTLQAALWAFETNKTFEEGLIAAVNLGGDADSIGAVYGQIAGAYYGFDAIPKRWVNAVKNMKKVNQLIEDFINVTFSL